MKGLLLALALLAPLSAASARDVVVASKNFPESRLLAEMFAQTIETETGLTVDRRLGLAGTQVCFEALRSGAIDLYPEYTGTGLVSILGEEPTSDPAQAMARVRRAFRDRFALAWLAPLGFENAYEVAVPETLARRHELTTLSDLARVAPRLDAGFGFEFVERPDGLPGLREVYGLEFASVAPMQQELKYQAVAANRIQVLDVYTTDGRLMTHGLRVLRDDRHLFPAYQAAPLVRLQTLERHPEIARALDRLSGAFDEQRMRELNLRLQRDGAAEAEVAQQALADLGILRAADAAPTSPATRRPGLGAVFWRDRAALAERTLEHLALTAVALLAGIAVAVPLGVGLERRRAQAEPLIRLIGMTQTIPSIALLAFMIPLLGVGFGAAVVALWIYSLFPILRNTYTGVRDAAPEAAEAALACGMTPT
ncbi:MAG: glycine betaine ABC transporter substrate-binding protein, partial [Thermoanaerobaculia bacterium]